MITYCWMSVIFKTFDRTTKCTLDIMIWDIYQEMHACPGHISLQNDLKLCKNIFSFQNYYYCNIKNETIITIFTLNTHTHTSSWIMVIQFSISKNNILHHINNIIMQRIFTFFSICLRVLYAKYFFFFLEWNVTWNDFSLIYRHLFKHSTDPLC